MKVKKKKQPVFVSLGRKGLMLSLSKKLYDSTLCSAKSVKSQSFLDLQAVFAFIFTDQL